jgi:hypothetical protein
MRQTLMVLLALTLLAACSSPDLARIEADFEQAYAGCDVLRVDVGEGDADHAYVHVRLRCKGERGEREEVWLYRRSGKEWRKIVRTD